MKRKNTPNQIRNKAHRIALKAGLVFAAATTALLAQPYGREFRFAPEPEFVENEVIVQYRDYVSGYQAQSISANTGGGVSQVLQHTPADQGPLHRVQLRGRSVAQAIADFRRNPNVKYAEPNYIYHLTAAPNDPLYSANLWGLNDTGQTISNPTYTTNNPGAATSGNDIDAQIAWNTITDCSSTTVAVIDSGVNYAHEDLSANMVNGSYSCPGGTGTRGCDFVGTGDADPQDDNGHGTHVAGTIGAVGNNSTGSTGVCWGAQILAVKACNAAGSCNSADIIEGINFAAGTGASQGNAKVINMSLGGVSPFSQSYSDAITNALNNDVVVVVAAGNNTQDHNSIGGGNAAYPCDFSHANLVCVAAVDQEFAIASFSDRDLNGTAANRKVDVGAPGVNIMSTYPQVTTDNFGGGALNWTTAGDAVWQYSTCLGSLDTLETTTFCNGATPANNLNGRVYKNFNLSGALHGASVSFYIWLQQDDSLDYWSMYYKSTGGDPFTGGTSVANVFGPINTGGVVSVSYDISGCNTAACTLGFRYRTDSNSNAAWDGVGIVQFSIKSFNNSGYGLLNGTSMASPHVAGIATMIRARNPDFTYADVVTALEDYGTLAGGISGSTKTGRVVNAANSLKHIPKTTGLSLSVL